MVHTNTLHCECPVFMGAQSNVYLLKQAWGSVGAGVLLVHFVNHACNRQHLDMHLFIYERYFSPLSMALL